MISQCCGKETFLNSPTYREEFMQDMPYQVCHECDNPCSLIPDYGMSDRELDEASRVEMFLPNGELNHNQGYLTGAKQVADAAQAKLIEHIKSPEMQHEVVQKILAYDRYGNGNVIEVTDAIINLLTGEGK